MLARIACTAYDSCMQYTVRNVPDALDAALRRRARERDKSLNETAIEAMARGLGIQGKPVRRRDVGGIAGSWREDPEFDAAIADQDTVDEELWR